MWSWVTNPVLIREAQHPWKLPSLVSPSLNPTLFVSTEEQSWHPGVWPEVGGIPIASLVHLLSTGKTGSTWRRREQVGPCIRAAHPTEWMYWMPTQHALSMTECVECKLPLFYYHFTSKKAAWVESRKPGQGPTPRLQSSPIRSILLPPNTAHVPSSPVTRPSLLVRDECLLLFLLFIVLHTWALKSCFDHLFC